MKYRLTVWASSGFLVAGGWALYALATTPPSFTSADPLLAIVRLTCPVAVLGKFYPMSVYAVLLANAATYATAGLVVEALRLHPAK